MIFKIDKNWRTFWDFTPDTDCDHEYEDDDIFDEGEYTGSFRCLKCNSVLSFDVSDIGD